MKPFSKKLQLGFSVVETVVSIGLVSLVVLSLTGLIDLKAIALRAMKNHGKKEDLRSYVRSAVSCEKTLQDQGCAGVRDKVVSLKTGNSTALSAFAGYSVRGRCGSRWGANQLYVEYMHGAPRQHDRHNDRRDDDNDDRDDENSWSDLFNRVPWLCSSETVLVVPMEIKIVADPVKVVIIIDDSSSMTRNQSVLGAGLMKALAELKDKHADVYLYSSSLFGNGTPYVGNTFFNYFLLPASVSGFSNDLALSGLSFHGNYFSKTKLPSLFTTITSTTGTVERDIRSYYLNHYPNKMTSKFTINKSGFSTPDGVIHFRPDMSEASFEAAIRQVAREVVIGEQGSPDERPLCTMASVLQNEGPYKIFNDADKRAAFLLIGDEDQTDQFHCPYQVESEYKGIIKKVAAPNYATNIYIKGKQRTDAGLGIETDFTPYFNVYTCAVGEPARDTLCRLDMPYRSYYPCSPDQQAWAVAKFKEYYAADIAAGLKSIEPNAGCTALKIENTNTREIVVGADFKATDPVTYNSVVYPNMLAAMKANFPRLEYTGEIRIYAASTGSNNTVTSLPGLSTTSKPQEIANWVKAKALSRFSRDNLLISVIGNYGPRNREFCPTASNTDPASTSLLSIADTSGPICSGDYSSSLAWMKSFSKLAITTTYTLDRKYMNGNYGFKLIAADEQIRLNPEDYRFDRDASTITLLKTPSDINKPWRLKVSLIR